MKTNSVRALHHVTVNIKTGKSVREILKWRWHYLFLLPAIACIFIFSYIPMYGVVLAFKDYRFVDGILGSPWIGFKHFETIFNSTLFYRVIRNTLLISFYRLLFGFPAPIILALLLNEINNRIFKRITQTISYLPYFISWVILAGIIIEILSPKRGVINFVISLFGVQPMHFLTLPQYFRPILVITGIWQGVGWGTIIYLAALSGIDSEQIEAAYIDGARRFHIIRWIIIPTIMPVISIVLILNLGSILNAGFDQIFNLYNPMVYETGDIIDTYTYRAGLMDMEYGYSTAVGLFKNVVGFLLIITANIIVRRFNEGERALF